MTRHSKTETDDKPAIPQILPSIYPTQRRHSEETKRKALILVAAGLTFRDAAAELSQESPEPVSDGSIVRWWARQASASDLEEFASQKRKELKVIFLHAADALAFSAVELGRVGEGNEAKGAMTAAAIATDKAQMLDGKPTSTRFSSSVQIHSKADIPPVGLSSELRARQKALSAPIEGEIVPKGM